MSDKPIEFELSQSIKPMSSKTENFAIKSTDQQITKPEQEDINNIHNLVQNARYQINKYKEENNVNEHENLLERLEQLKNLRDRSQVQPNEFQQMLNRIKERNFNDRMAYIMERIKVSHRDDDKLELDHNGEPLEDKSIKGVKKIKLLLLVIKNKLLHSNKNYQKILLIIQMKK